MCLKRIKKVMDTQCYAAERGTTSRLLPHSSNSNSLYGKFHSVSNWELVVNHNIKCLVMIHKLSAIHHKLEGLL